MPEHPDFDPICLLPLAVSRAFRSHRFPDPARYWQRWPYRLPTDRFIFAGFVPSTATARQEAFRELASLSATSVWFATPSKLATSLSDMAEIFGQRQAAITRELTKLHEEVLQGTLSDLATSLSGGAPLKGEIVLVVAGRARDEAGIDDATLDAMLRAELEGQRLREAVKSVVASTGLARNHVYRRAALNEEAKKRARITGLATGRWMVRRRLTGDQTPP